MSNAASAVDREENIFKVLEEELNAQGCSTRNPSLKTTA
jgi:hypothetical protein